MTTLQDYGTSCNLFSRGPYAVNFRLRYSPHTSAIQNISADSLWIRERDSKSRPDSCRSHPGMSSQVTARNLNPDAESAVWRSFLQQQRNTYVPAFRDSPFAFM